MIVFWILILLLVAALALLLAHFFGAKVFDATNKIYDDFNQEYDDTLKEETEEETKGEKEND